MDDGEINKEIDKPGAHEPPPDKRIARAFGVLRQAVFEVDNLSVTIKRKVYQTLCPTLRPGHHKEPCYIESYRCIHQ